VSLPPFEELVERHGARVLRVCRAVVGPDLAEDAWSETFLKALQAYPRLPADANVEAWLVTIAHRAALDQVRAQRRRAVPVGELEERADERTVGLDPDLVAQIAALPDKQRHAVAYHYVAGLPYDAVAEILGGSADAARRAAADGINALRRTLPTHARTHR
jgi:RNA polymerase sigma factor (sigma-70 family)